VTPFPFDNRAIAAIAAKQRHAEIVGGLTAALEAFEGLLRETVHTIPTEQTLGLLGSFLEVLGGAPWDPDKGPLLGPAVKGKLGQLYSQLGRLAERVKVLPDVIQDVLNNHARRGFIDEARPYISPHHINDGRYADRGLKVVSSGAAGGVVTTVTLAALAAGHPARPWIEPEAFLLPGHPEVGLRGPLFALPDDFNEHPYADLARVLKVTRQVKARLEQHKIETAERIAAVPKNWEAAPGVWPK